MTTSWMCLVVTRASGHCGHDSVYILNILPPNTWAGTTHTRYHHHGYKYTYREKSCIQLLNWLQIISDLDEIILFQLMRYYEYGLDVVVVAIKTFTLWTGHWHWGDYLHNWLQSSLLLFHLSCVHPVLFTTALPGDNNFIVYKLLRL